MVRTLVDGDVVEKPPKTGAGARTLPLDDALTDSLRAFHALRASEKLAAGEVYTAGGSPPWGPAPKPPGVPERVKRLGWEKATGERRSQGPGRTLTLAA